MVKKAKENPRSTTADDGEIARKICERRHELGMSQEALGDKLGISFQQVQKYEKGVNRITSSRLGDIAKALKVPVAYFYAPSDIKAKDVESLLNRDPTSSLRLLRAYSKIDHTTAHRLVLFMEGLAGY